MSNQISGLTSRYVTNSTPQDTTQTNTQSYGLLRQRDQATVLDFSPEKGRRIRERRARRRRTAVDATRRRPTSRLANPRSGERPLRRLTRPNTDGSVSGLDTARRIHFSSRLTNDPTRSTTSADSLPPDGLDSALPADSRTGHGRQRRRTRLRSTDSLQLSRLTHDPARSTTSADSFPPDGPASALPADSRRQDLPHLSTTSTTEQTARSTDPQSARRFRTASITQRISSIRTADADKTCVLHDFSPLNELFSRNSRQPRGTHMTG